MDFEGSGCDDTDADICTADNGYDADCASGTSSCTIGAAGAALFSGYTVGDGTNRYMEMLSHLQEHSGTNWFCDRDAIPRPRAGYSQMPRCG